MKIKECTIIIIVMIVYAIGLAISFYVIPLENEKLLREVFGSLTLLMTITLYLALKD